MRLRNGRPRNHRVLNHLPDQHPPGQEDPFQERTLQLHQGPPSLDGRGGRQRLQHRHHPLHLRLRLRLGRGARRDDLGERGGLGADSQHPAARNCLDDDSLVRRHSSSLPH